REGLLDEAETRLRRVLEVPKTTASGDHTISNSSSEPMLDADWKPDLKNPYRWAWARLGEVCRQQANRPSFESCWSDRELQIKLWTASGYYKASKICFDIALHYGEGQQRSSDLQDSWAKAHYGAMIANSRR